VSDRPQIAFVSREVAPFYGGGIGTYVTAIARLLAPVADVKVFTTTRHGAAHRAMSPAGARLLEGFELVFVEEPRSWDIGETEGTLSLWSVRAFDAVCAAYPDGGPDLLEYPDYLGEAFVAAQACRAGDRRLARTTVCARAYTTGEMTAILDSDLRVDFETRLNHQIERYALANCDHFVWPGGDVLGTYQRFFGEGAVAAPVRVRHPLLDEGAGPPAEWRPSDSGLLRLLYVGRLERRKGVFDLARAISAIDDDRLRLTLLGGDTEHAPLGQSARSVLEVMVGDDPRVEFIDRLPRGQLPSIFDRHDAVVLPSLWECWPAVGLEALERNRPILATPTGGFNEMVEPGVSGWLTEGPGAEPLAKSIEGLLERPEQVGELIAAGGPASVYERLTDADEIRDAYLALAAERGSRATARATFNGDAPLVSVVIPYFRLDGFIEAAVASAAGQTHSRVEILVVNDGSFREADAVLARIAERSDVRLLTQVNSGLGAARNAGVIHARGDYVVFLDADNVLEPAFVERCLAVLESNPELAYVTAWLRYIDERGEPWHGSQPGYHPLGNWTELVEERNVAGDAVALFRRSVFDGGLAYSPELTSFEDWALYREMRQLGLIGTVIPERLVDYRIRERSMLREIGSPNQERIESEIRAHIRETLMSWTPPK
jgi:glycogen(starch) synthase